MEFSEKDLVKLFMDEGYWEGHFPLSQRQKKKGHHYWNGFDYKLEYPLKSGKRCDLVVFNDSRRFFWLVEFKKCADIGALLQVLEYYDEICIEKRQKTKYFFGCVSLAAQYFHPQVLQLALRLGIECVHLCPINSSQLHINEAVYPPRETFFKVNSAPRTRIEDNRFLGVVNG